MFELLFTYYNEIGFPNIVAKFPHHGLISEVGSAFVIDFFNLFYI